MTGHSFGKYSWSIKHLQHDIKPVISFKYSVIVRPHLMTFLVSPNQLLSSTSSSQDSYTSQDIFREVSSRAHTFRILPRGE